MLARTNPAINQAYAVLRELSEDEATRLRYEARLKAQRDEWSRMAGARLEGRESRQAELVRGMANEGIARSLIAKIADLTEAEVGTLLRGA